MPRSKLDPTTVDALLDFVDQDINPGKDRAAADIDWTPPLGPTQLGIYECDAKFILAHGEKGSGKTFILGGHKLVNHLYDNFNAHALIVVRVRGQGTGGGAWHKLTTEILPEWKAEQGVEYSEPYTDSQRNETIDLRNRYGGWSRVTLLSEEHGPSFAAKIRNYEPSYGFVDELTTMTEEFFTALAAQLGRRKGIRGPQQWTAATNPDSPRHWVYRTFFEEPWEEYRDPETDEVEKPEGVWDSDFAVFHVPFAENARNLPPGYQDRITKIYRGDATMLKRMRSGEWVDRPSGKALFRDVFIPELHVRGGQNGSTFRRVLPNPKWDIHVGWDTGGANNAVVLMQLVPIRDANVWVIFDEFVHLGRRVKFEVLVPKLLERVLYWQNLVNGGKKFRMTWISGKDPMNQFRPGAGSSYDYMEIERISELHAKRLGVPEIELEAAPAFKGSRQTRVRLVKNRLSDNQIIVSATCTNVIASLTMLEAESDKKDYDPELSLTPKRSPYLHTFDAFSYVMLAVDAEGGVTEESVPMSVVHMR